MIHSRHTGSWYCWSLKACDERTAGLREHERQELASVGLAPN
jgi:hypothetical protein